MYVLAVCGLDRLDPLQGQAKLYVSMQLVAAPNFGGDCILAATV